MSYKAFPLFSAFCENKKISYFILPIPSPYHSRAVEVAVPGWKDALKKISSHRPRCEYISGYTGKAGMLFFHS
jgi:hypothetical protein